MKHRDYYDVFLMEVGSSRPTVLEAINSLTDCGDEEAVRIADHVPSKVGNEQSWRSKEAANNAKLTLESAGATVEIRPVEEQPRTPEQEKACKDLFSHFEKERINAANILGERGSRQDLDSLMEALEIETRREAAEAIGNALGRIGAHWFSELCDSLEEGIMKGGRTREMILESLPRMKMSLRDYQDGFGWGGLDWSVGQAVDDFLNRATST